jgi:hypothetical protein
MTNNDDSNFPNKLDLTYDEKYAAFLKEMAGDDFNGDHWHYLFRMRAVKATTRLSQWNDKDLSRWSK